MDNFEIMKHLIKILSENYNYKVEKFLSKDGEEHFWGISRQEGYNRVAMVFLAQQNFSRIDKETYIYRNYWEYNSLEFIKIIISDDSIWMDKGFTDELNEKVIVISGRNERVLFFTYGEESLALQINEILQKKKKYKRKNTVVFDSSAKATYILMSLNILMFIITAFMSKNFINSDTDVLIKLGAKVNSLISSGEYYRLITAAFLHGGFIHLAVNMYALNALGPLVEKVYGRTKFLIIYFVAAIMSSYFSFLFSSSVSIGASGAIFGLLGATLAFAYKMRSKIGTRMVSNVFSVIVLNVIIGVTLPNIDNFGHLGGLVGGMLISLALGFKTINNK
ncbi:rhomboid family intramembrane serine protease [Clostridium grantii]|uniref:Rhomboid protease GluP n=1 Tax=Clostridium grantii DSM 8605 TaxID=1121316 RepID=A0A1M5UW97_9CLOT|nr:rhomboid family intramembrane serine protease [Clostridium grantii]SHH66993.1 rhomboid protease GluP [Clostridium grantii DSM 8605]